MISHVYLNLCDQRPSMSGLFRRGVGGHDSAVQAALGANVPQCLVLCHILMCASNLVVLLAVLTSGASVPNWDVVAT